MKALGLSPEVAQKIRPSAVEGVFAKGIDTARMQPGTPLYGILKRGAWAKTLAVAWLVVTSLSFTGGVEGSPIDYPVTAIRIVPLGAIPASDVQVVHQIVGQEFPRMTVTVGDPLELPSASFDSERTQYNAQALLGLLAQGAPNRGVRVVGVTDADLFSPGLNYVFSSAQPKGSAVVMSLYRLRDPRESLSRERYRKIVLRALGFTFGFESSLDRSCVMAFSNSLQALDEKGTAWCSNEPEALQRIQGLR